jgi:2-polyprenyl-6-methoxyphenol hydroxylase-like FAD-dependent oxidoreductase
MTDGNSSNTYDAIVIGARCAGSPTAMLLARRGYRVLLVDRARFPSDTLSTHLVHPPGVAALERWGLLDRLAATGCPPITTYSFDFGPLTIAGAPAFADGTAVAYCPRRTVLDKLLIDAADEAGAEVREGFVLDELVCEDGRVVGIRGRPDGGAPVVERARVVVGADGAHSKVAKLVGARTYNEKPMFAVVYYSYWSGIAVDEVNWTLRLPHGYGFSPTHGGLTMLMAAWPVADLHDVRKDVEGSYLGALRLFLGDRLEAARREERIMGGNVPSHFRRPYGPGWALVGDAGYLKDAITAQGIADAFHDAEQCTAALDEALTGTRSFDDAMADHHRRRDARVRGIFEFTTQIGTMEPPPPELLQLFGAIAGNQPAMDEFASVWAGALSPETFFDPAHIGQLVGPPA